VMEQAANAQINNKTADKRLMFFMPNMLAQIEK
jgi:hypothetical protein